MPTLVAEWFAPWSEKAKWALEHHGVAFAYREHVPLVGEIPLRIRTRRLLERATTPALLTREGVLMDSFAIAGYADRHGRGPKLLPDGASELIASWNDRSERALAAGRALYLERLSRDPEAKAEMQPAFVPAALRGLLAAEPTSPWRGSSASMASTRRRSPLPKPRSRASSTICARLS